MFKHIFITRVKCLIRNKQMIFWTLVFPIVLATLFKAAFTNLSSHDVFKVIDIAVVNNQYYEDNQGFKGAIEQVYKDGPDKLFNVTFTEEKNAEELLKNSKIAGYIYLNPEINLAVKSSGLNETVIKTFLDNYKERESTIEAIAKADPRAVNAGLIKDISTFKEYTKEVSPSRGEPDITLNYFYSLIAMTCLYGGFLGLKEITDIQGDLSKRAARINIAPVHKMKVFIYGLSAAFLIQFAEILTVLGYLKFALNVDFGSQLSYILLLCFVGCAAGTSLGTMVSALVKKDEGIKTGILIGVSMAGCFLAGLQYANMKYIVEKKAPILAYINPAALITDGFYSLYYYRVSSSNINLCMPLLLSTLEEINMHKLSFH
ncbi:MAG: ABC transporter permease [Clostridiaceae bacterium]